MEWAAVVAGALSLILLIVKYFFSDDAEKKRLEEEFQKEEKARQEAIAKALRERQAKAPGNTEGWENSWDAADREMNTPPKGSTK